MKNNILEQKNIGRKEYLLLRCNTKKISEWYEIITFNSIGIMEQINSFKNLQEAKEYFANLESYLQKIREYKKIRYFSCL